MPIKLLLTTASLGLVAACTAANLPKQEAGGGDWPSYALDVGASRESPLLDISAENIDRLAPAWHVDFAQSGGRAFEATPIVVDGTMYVTTAYSRLYALDATTGEQLWSYDPQVPMDLVEKGCCGPVSRGVAYAYGAVFLPSYDGRLTALDADSGAVLWSKMTVDPEDEYTITGAPMVAGDLVLIGNGGAEFGVRGYVTAYDLRTGEKAWRFYTVPPRPGTSDGEVSDAIWSRFSSSWAGEWWRNGDGGGTVWDSMAFDPELGLVYIGVGNGSAWNRQLRTGGAGDNLFLSSILALDAETGEYAWHFQTTPGDEWDYTATQSIILADIEYDGRERKVLMQAPKNGYFYVLDRESGEFLSGEAYVQVSWSTGLDPETGRPEIVDSARYSENGEASLQTPGPFGGHNWHPMSYSSQAGLAFIPAIEAGFRYEAAAEDFSIVNWTPSMGLDGIGTAFPLDAAAVDGLAQQTHGKLIAWDPVRQEAAWTVEHPVPWNGGTLVTASGLVFQGDAEGHLNAYDAATGQVLWSHAVGTGIVAAPMTYSVDGVQYVAIAAGYGGALPLVAGALTPEATVNGLNRLAIFRLDGTDSLDVPQVAAREANLPAATALAEVIQNGWAQYERFCAYCHGSSAISSGVLPDLRHSAVSGSRESFEAVVADGAFSARGMPAMGDKIAPQDIEAIRQFVLSRAQAVRQDQ